MVPYNYLLPLINPRNPILGRFLFWGQFLYNSAFTGQSHGYPFAVQPSQCNIHLEVPVGASRNYCAVPFLQHTNTTPPLQVASHGFGRLLFNHYRYNIHLGVPVGASWNHSAVPFLQHTNTTPPLQVRATEYLPDKPFAVQPYQVTYIWESLWEHPGIRVQFFSRSIPIITY